MRTEYYATREKCHPFKLCLSCGTCCSKCEPVNSRCREDGVMLRALGGLCFTGLWIPALALTGYIYISEPLQFQEGGADRSLVVANMVCVIVSIVVAPCMYGLIPMWAPILLLIWACSTGSILYRLVFASLCCSWEPCFITISYLCIEVLTLISILPLSLFILLFVLLPWASSYIGRCLRILCKCKRCFGNPLTLTAQVIRRAPLPTAMCWICHQPKPDSRSNSRHFHRQCLQEFFVRGQISELLSLLGLREGGLNTDFVAANVEAVIHFNRRIEHSPATFFYRNQEICLVQCAGKGQILRQPTNADAVHTIRANYDATLDWQTFPGMCCYRKGSSTGVPQVWLAWHPAKPVAQIRFPFPTTIVMERWWVVVNKRNREEPIQVGDLLDQEAGLQHITLTEEGNGGYINSPRPGSIRITKSLHVLWETRHKPSAPL